MPVKNSNHLSNQSYNGVITGLTEDEKKAIDDSGLLDKAASKLVYDNGFILLDKDGKVIEGQDDPVTFTDKFNVEENTIDINTLDIGMTDVAIDNVSSVDIKFNVSGTGTPLTSIKVGNTLYTNAHTDAYTKAQADAKFETITDFNSFKQTAVITSGNQTINGVKTFKEPIHTNQVANENGGALLRYKDTESVAVFGGISYPALIMGSTKRPKYSNDGSDFSGEELALLSDVQSGGGSDLPTDPTTDGDYGLLNKVASGASTKSWTEIDDVSYEDASVDEVGFVEVSAVPTDTDGTYVLKATVASGAVTFSWVKE